MQKFVVIIFINETTSTVKQHVTDVAQLFRQALQREHEDAGLTFFKFSEKEKNLLASASTAQKRHREHSLG